MCPNDLLNMFLPLTDSIYLIENIVQLSCFVLSDMKAYVTRGIIIANYSAFSWLQYATKRQQRHCEVFYRDTVD